MRIMYGLAPAIAVIAFAVFAGQAKADSDAQRAPEIRPHPMNSGESDALVAGSTGAQSPRISFHGGPVMGTPTVYMIWYGNWNQSNGSDTPSGQTIIRDLFHGLNRSAYYQINTSYGTPTGSVAVGGEFSDNYSQGRRLSDARVQAVVNNALSGGHLPRDPNGVYFVLTSSDVSESSGFCSRYCGWHTEGTIAGSSIKYSFVGNANRCLNSCAAQTTGPNGNAGVDGMASVIAHELEETNTDPGPGPGWFDANGAENGDKCAWTFGAHQSVAPNGAFYNVTLPALSVPARHYLIQRNLDANSICYINYETKEQ